MTAIAEEGRAPGPGLLLLIVAPFGLGYFLSYFLRNVNAVIAPRIVEEFALDAAAMGLLTSLYFLAAALVLVPVAVALDRFGPRRVLILQLLVTAAGAAIFALSAGPLGLMAGRLLIGLGVAGCLTTAFKAVTVWFPRERWATGNSIVLAIGSLGVIAGTRPLQLALDAMTWREVFWLVAAMSLAVALALAPAPERNAPRAGPEVSSAAVYRAVLSNGFFWRAMPIASLSMATFFALQGLWANPWMSDVGGLSQEQIGDRLLAMAFAMSAGMLLNGSLGDALSARGVPLSAPMSVGLLALLLAQLVLVLGWAPQAYWPWAVIGYTGNIGALAYPQISRRFPSHVAARAMSVLAMCNFAFAFLVQSALGFLVALWPPLADGRYPGDAYRTSLGGFLAVQAAFFLWFLSSPGVWRPAVDPAEARTGAKDEAGHA